MSKWELKNGQVIYLLTPTQLKALPDGTPLIDIFSERSVKSAETDMDTRFGYTAFAREEQNGHG